MRLILFLFILFYVVNASSSEKCPNEDVFLENGWIIHNEENFDQILEDKLSEFTPEVGTDLIVDQEAYYLSEFSHDMYLIMWVVIWDRVSTSRDEMWGDIAFSRTDPCTGEYTEIRWYDPVTKTKHIVCNPRYFCCLSTKIPLAYNTIF